MSFFKEDYYDECKYYCLDYELVHLLDDMIFDSDYNDLDKESLEKIKENLISNMEFLEKKRLGYVLKW